MTSFIPEAQLDYHDLGILSVEEINYFLDKFIEEQVALGHTKVIIVTGKGKVVRPVVEKRLSKCKFISGFNSAGYFNGQEGAFEVELLDN